MSESATAERAYFHTLNARPYFFATDSRDLRLGKVTSSLLDLPAEIRFKIYEHAFIGNRVAVTARNGCYCASEGTGPYRADHKWLLNDVSGGVRQDAQHAFIKMALWELHCDSAFSLFLRKMATLNAIDDVRHVRINVFETSRVWSLPLDSLPRLRTVTFSPWQKGWTIDLPAREDSEQLSDVHVMERVHHVLHEKDGYEPVRALLESSRRSYEIFFVFPIRYLLPGKVLPYRWQLKVWRANLDTAKIDRDWNEVHLVQEATLD